MPRGISKSIYWLLTACLVVPAMFWSGLSIVSAAGKKTPTTRPQPPKKKAKPSTRTLPAKAKAKSKKKKKKKVKPRVLSSWLQLGPAPLPFPVFAKEKGGKVSASKLFKHRLLDLVRLKAKAGKRVDWLNGDSFAWKQVKNPSWKPSGKIAKVSYLATWIHTSRFTKLAMKVKSHQRVQIFLGSRLVGTKAGCTRLPKKKKAKKSSKKAAKKKATGKKVNKTKTGKKAKAKSKKKKKKKPGAAKARLTLTTGTHRLLIKTFWSAECVQDWGVNATVKANRGFPAAKTLKISTNPASLYSLDFYFHRTRLGANLPSPDGKWMFLNTYKVDRRGRSVRMMEIRNILSGRLALQVPSSRGMRGLKWSYTGRFHSYIVSSRGKGALWLVNSLTSQRRRLLTGLKGLSSHWWVPGGKFLVIALYKKTKVSKMARLGFKRLKGMEHRWPWSRGRYTYYLVNAKSGVKIRLTAGKLNPSVLSFSSDGRRMLFSRSTRFDYSQFPFSRSHLYEMDLRTFKIKKLLSDLKFFAGASYSPDGKQLLVLGGPTLFGKKGHSPELRKGQIPNEYDKQAYIYDLKTKKVDPITKTFKPHVRAVYWHPMDGHLYFSVLDRTRTRLFRYVRSTRTFSVIPTGAGVELVSRVRFARFSTRIVYQGWGVAMPQRLYTLDLKNPKPRLLLDPNAKALKKMQLARVKFWSFKNKRGEKLDGRIYFPANFDSSRKYPTIVYYYGGTFPTYRTFDGSYSGQWWASQGYLVLIVQPSGAIGFGQRFSAYHSNEWGTIVPDEIIGATKQYLKQHPYADPKRVGCIGASYGGFTTMSIVTRTRLFAAAVSHAGISNIASYWGVGYWGYLYNTRSAPRRYPWSHPKFYSRQSPLFNAHKIHTPLLLTHGAVDTNVPPGESLQLYAALKLLKRPVELLLVKKENHWIAQRKRRKIWMRSIVAFFDRYLKKQPQWWESMYGKLPKAKKKKKKTTKK